LLPPQAARVNVSAAINMRHRTFFIYCLPPFSYYIIYYTIKNLQTKYLQICFL
jgi:hypothetical protein